MKLKIFTNIVKNKNETKMKNTILINNCKQNVQIYESKCKNKNEKDEMKIQLKQLLNTYTYI